ncbi:MAG: murein biosynthesis integral membrane protein MurJ [Anaerolineaceae bacterium]|nr:murein biosynthesis integral membrane protein MurJ [Anaerolineaceae bacterium]
MVTLQAGESPARHRRRLARSTLLVILAFAGAKLISLVQTVVIAQVFGLSSDYDAYVAANGLPELIYTLIAGGAMAHAFIPVFSGLLARGDRHGAWRTASLVINSVFLVTLLLSLLTFLGAHWLTANLVAPGFDAEAQEQTVVLMRILLLTTLIFSISGLCMGILQSHNHFLLPALAPVLYDVGILFGVIFLIPGIGIHGIAWGAVLGALLHLGIQVPGLLHYRARWWPLVDPADARLREILRLMLPRIAGLGVFSLNFLVMNNIASRLGEGSVSALNWGWRVMQIPQTLIGTAMGTVIFPTLAALSELGDDDGKRDFMSGALRFILVASIPAAVGLILLGQSIVALLERGAFDASASSLVTSTLRFFALGLVVHSVLEVVARSYYADKDTVTPLWAALGGATINLAGAFLFSGVLLVENNGNLAGPLALLPLQDLDRGVAGLALANSLGTAFEVAVLLWILRRRWRGIQESALAQTLLRTTAASLLMALAIMLSTPLFSLLSLPGGIVGDALQVMLQVLIGAVVFLLSALLLGMSEIGLLWHIWRGRRKSNGESLGA